MTPDDTRAVLKILRAGFPGRSPELGDDIAMAWWDRLRDVDARDAATAARDWIGGMPEFPSLSRFAQHAAGIRRRRLEAARPSLPEGTLATREENLTNVRSILSGLRAQRTTLPPGDAGGIKERTA